MLHLKRWKNFSVSEFLKKEIEPIVIGIVKVCVLVVDNMRVLKYVGTENCV